MKLIVIRLIALFYRIARYCEREVRRNEAKRAGLSVKEGTKLIGDIAFGTEPYLIDIGRNCLITDGVKFITHDGGVQVPMIASGATMKDVYSKKVHVDMISIGDNVFIGVDSIILYGTSIGSNSVIAAGSVVKGIFPNDVVIGGVPAKVISSLSEYEDKHKAKLIDVSATTAAKRKREIQNMLNV